MARDFVPRAELDVERVAREVAGDTAEMEALDLTRTRMGDAARENMHNFAQLEAADFPGAITIEVVARTFLKPIAQAARLMGRDVELYAGGRSSHAIGVRRLRGYVLRKTHAYAEPWQEPESFALGDTKEMALVENGSACVISEDRVADRGCLVVDLKKFLSPAGLIRSPAHLSQETAYHLHELTVRSLTDAGIEYVPFRP